MSAHRYSVAGWLAVTLVPLYFIGGVVIVAQHVVAAVKGNLDALPLGPGDVLAGLLGLVSAYLYIVFLRLLHERYNFRGADIYIKIEIAIGFLAGLVMTPLLFIFQPDSATLEALFVPLFLPLMLICGILEIQIARKIMAAKSEFSSMIPSYATVLMASGICWVSIIFSFVPILFLEPIALVMLGMVFLREKEQVEFV